MDHEDAYSGLYQALGSGKSAERNGLVAESERNNAVTPFECPNTLLAVFTILAAP